ncbi:MAG: SIS domain-containing protein, partial [Candidatus Aenigmarchaeota archaeon]|nr:SIS domain-containing protein [Candidatus Aenigmarchaeota archaeon]
EVPLEVSMEDIYDFNLKAIKNAFHKEHNRRFGYELKEEGMDVVSQFKELYPHNTIVANTRTITDAEKEFSSAFAAGADIACILAITDIEEIKKAVSVAKKYKKKVMADLIGLRECIGEERLIKRAKELEKIGVDFVRYYQSENDLLHSKIVPPKSIKRISQELSIPVAVAGGVNKQSAYNISKAGVGIVIVGSEIAKSENPAEAIKKIKEKITDDMGSVIEDVLEILSSQLKEVAENIDENIIAQILDSIDKDSRIVLTGAGRSGLVARYAGAWLGKIADTRIISAGDEDIAVDFGKRKKDILFAISSSGNTYSVMEYVNTLREKGARIIGITTNAQGKAWDEKDTLLVIKGRTKDDFKSKEKDLISKRTPLGTISEFSVLVVLTSLVEAYMVGKKPSYMKKYILDISDELLRQKEIIHDQYEKIETLIDAILETRKSSKIVLQAYGRMHTIAKLFASRLYQISGTKIMIIGSSVVKRIDEKDVAVILSLSGRIKETHYATQVLNDIGIVPYFFLSGKKTLVQELINSKKATGIYVQDKEESYTEKISWFEKQFSSGKNYRYPSEFKGEILLLGFLEGIFACMYEKLCLEEKDLLHIKYLE